MSKLVTVVVMRKPRGKEKIPDEEQICQFVIGEDDVMVWKTEPVIV